MFAHFGLTISDVEELPTHGGSLRIYARPSNAEEIAVSASVERLLEKEREAQLHELPVYQAFNQKIQQVKRDALSYLIAEKNAGKRIAAFGAPAKGNTFLNYCGIGRDFIEFTVDATLPVEVSSCVKEITPHLMAVCLKWLLAHSRGLRSILGV